MMIFRYGKSIVKQRSLKTWRRCPQACLVRSPRNVRSKAAELRNSVFLLRNWRDCGKRSQIALRLDVENLRTLHRHTISLIELTFMNIGVRDKHIFNMAET
jgi:hypothetical protein